jgi:transcriptional regulator with GAF, ATPase, and Fis domain
LLLHAQSVETTALPYTETERLRRDRTNILAALQLTHGKVSGEDGAAELLGIKPTTLASRMQARGVKKSKYAGSYKSQSKIGTRCYTSQRSCA